MRTGTTESECESYLLTKIASLHSTHFGTLYALAESLRIWVHEDPGTRLGVVFSLWHKMQAPLQKRLLQSFIANSSEKAVLYSFLSLTKDEASYKKLKEIFRHLTPAQILAIIEMWDEGKIPSKKFKIFATVMHSEIKEMARSFKTGM